MYWPQLVSQNCKQHISQTVLHIGTSAASCSSRNW